MQFDDHVGLRWIGDKLETMYRIEACIERVVRTQSIGIFLVARIADKDALRARQQGWQWSRGWRRHLRM